MFTFPIFRRHDDRTTSRRPTSRRRPLVEDLEGRQLLSSFIQGSHIGVAVSEIQGSHIGSMVVGQHIG